MKNNQNMIPMKLSCWVNGNRLEEIIPPGITALELLNGRLSLHGTKSSCNEGDCGACTVLVARRKGRRVIYQAVNSCLYPAVRLQGKHLITIEGLAVGGELHPIQTALLDRHGTQCGFCTPGFVMSLLGMFLNNPRPNREEILAALEGNLCRCTGYDSIMQAAELARDRLDGKQDLLPASLRKVERHLKEDFTVHAGKPVSNEEGFATIGYHAPASLQELWQILRSFRSDSDFKFLAGGTDLMVLVNIQHIHYPHLIDLTNLAELEHISSDARSLHIGANVTLAQLQQDKSVHKHFPLLEQAIRQMASTQIRNTATLAGNLANASPVADGAATLLALGAEAVLSSEAGDRKVPLAAFFHSYKQTELGVREIIREIVLPLPRGKSHFCNFIKSAKRKAVDISGVVSAIDLEHKNGRITKARISFGGVAPYPALAEKTMAYLKGKKLLPGFIEEAAMLAAGEFAPISDVRGSDAYRALLIRNHVISHLTAFRDSIDPKGRKEE